MVYPSKLRQTQFVYYLIFVVTVIACWFPSNLLSYIVPILSLGTMFVYSKSTLIRSLIFFSFVILWILLWSIFKPDFIVQNSLLSVITYSGLYLPLLFPTKYLSSRLLLKKMLTVLFIVMIIQASIGTLQFISGFIKYGEFAINLGDLIEGTLDRPLSPGGFETPIYSANMFLYLIVLIPVYLEETGKIPKLLLFGLLVTILATVAHQILFVFIGLLISYLLYKPLLFRIKGLGNEYYFIVLLVVLMAIVFLTLPVGFSQFESHFQRLINFENPKVVLFRRLINQVPRDNYFAPFIGLGPGQFSSRASLIGSELYLGGMNNPIDIPIIEGKTTIYVKEHLMDLWLWAENLPRPAGSTLRPFSSWLSVISEFGIFGILLTIFIIYTSFFKVRNKLRTNLDRILAFSLGAGIIFIFLLGFQENYWEVPQAIFPGLLLLKVVRSNLYIPSREN